MARTLGPRDLLEYNSEHSLLICRECKYAIQKNALASHLLRHKIYRGEKQRLLSSISKLELLDPDDVPLPPAGSCPVAGLQIIPGYKCTATDCDRLCASSKRMRRHWNIDHDVKDPPDYCGSSVNLQTFFRGNKLKYFEVVVTQPSAAKTFAPYPGSSLNLDLETLRYFHHFTINTSLTLPVKNYGREKYWQSDVVTQALELRWLMYGLLAISASHLSVLSDNESDKSKHQEQGARLLHEFYAEWEKVKHDALALSTEAGNIGAHMVCVLRCCHGSFDSPDISQGWPLEALPFAIPSFMMIVHGCFDRDLALRMVTGSARTQVVPMAQAADDLAGTFDGRASLNLPQTLLKRFNSLPYRMSEVLERPDDIEDFYAAVSAINSLDECFSLSCASDDLEGVTRGMISWVRKLSAHFKHMLWQKSPAALIVLSHWLLLAQRPEGQFWMLRVAAAKILHQIVEGLPEDQAIRNMVVNLLE